MNFVEAILFGLKYLPPRGAPGSISHVGDNAFGIIEDPASGLCPIVGAEFGKGRILGLGHNGYILDPTVKVADPSDDIATRRLRRLNRNMVLWSTHSECQYLTADEAVTKDISCGPLCEQPDTNFISNYPFSVPTNCIQPITIAAIGIQASALATYATNIGLASTPGALVPGIAVTSSTLDNIRRVVESNPDIILWTNSDLNQEILSNLDSLDIRSELLLQYVHQGGALVISFCPWGWESLTNGQATLDQNCIFNQVADRAGIHFTGEVPWPETDEGWLCATSIQRSKSPPPTAQLSSTLQAISSGQDVSYDDFDSAMTFYSNLPVSVFLPDVSTFNEQLTSNLAKPRALVNRVDDTAQRFQPTGNMFPFQAARPSNNRLSNDLAKKFLYMEWLHSKTETCPVRELSPFTPATLEFPGKVTSSRRVVDFLVSLNPFLANWQSTGIYVPPGEVVDVTLSDQAMKDYANFTYQVFIGCHTDQLYLTKDDPGYQLARHRRLTQSRQWRPKVVGLADDKPFGDRSPSATTNTMHVGSVYGGLLYIAITSNDLQNSQVAIDTPLVAKVSGGVQVPYVNLQKEKNEIPWSPQTDSYDFTSSWADRIAKFGGAPWGELEGRYLILSVPLAPLLKLEDPYSIIDHWDSMAAHELALAGETLKRKERFVPDMQISVGYMHSGYPLMTHLDIYEDTDRGIPQMFDLQYLKDNVMWGLYHEFGHNRQQSAWTWKGLTEVTVNIFSLYAAEMINGIKPYDVDYYTQNCRTKALAYLQDPSQTYDDVWDVDVNVALSTYVLLIEEFGWDVIAAIFRAYDDRAVTARCVDDQSKLNEWVRQSSLATNMDLRPMYKQWRWPFQDSNLHELETLPKWDKNCYAILSSH